MKSQFFPITALLTFLALEAGTFVLTAQDKPAAAPATATNGDKESAALVGTWVLKSQKYGDAEKFQEVNGEQRRIKLITPGHFVWVNHDTKANTTAPNSQSVAGGTYTLKGDQYVESVEYGDAQMARFFGKTTLMLKIEGDEMQLSGQLANGFKITEIWKREK